MTTGTARSRSSRLTRLNRTIETNIHLEIPDNDRDNSSRPLGDYCESSMALSRCSRASTRNPGSDLFHFVASAGLGGAAGLWY